MIFVTMIFFNQLRWLLVGVTDCKFETCGAGVMFRFSKHRNFSAPHFSAVTKITKIISDRLPVTRTKLRKLAVLSFIKHRQKENLVKAITNKKYIFVHVTFLSFFSLRRKR